MYTVILNILSMIMANKREVFQHYYANLCELLPIAVEELLPHLVQEEEEVRVTQSTSLKLELF